MAIHAIAALLFGAAALSLRGGAGGTVPVRRLASALVFTALWALAIAGIGNEDVVARVLLSARDLAWLWTLSGIAGRVRGTPTLAGSRRAAFGAVALCALAPAMLAIVVAPGTTDAAMAAAIAAPVRAAALALRMLFAAAAATLAFRVLTADANGSGGRRVLVAALALWWSIDLANTAFAYLLDGWTTPLVIARGVATLLLAPAIAVAVHRGGAWRLSVSQAIAVRVIGLVATALYALATAGLVGLLGSSGAGTWARTVQTALVVGAATSLLTLASTPWLRAWTRVMVAKHLFAHRYDYRAAWTRFGETLARPHDGGVSLGTCVLKALAQLTDSPAALLLTRDGDALTPGASWLWVGAQAPIDAALVAHMEALRRIVDLGAVRSGDAPADEIVAVPEWLAADTAAWALVPLLHFDRLVGMVVLAAPPLARALDWEDFDLLGVAGRQAATLLAEEHAAAALAEARRFEEFNRRFAFIMHDLKNLVSQTALVARNAEKHGADAAFRADMVETLRDTSNRMTTLLARLGRHGAQVTEKAQPVSLLTLARRVAAPRRGDRPVEIAGEDAVVTAQPGALDTALHHLLQNADDASAPGAPVTITVTAHGDHATLAIADRGTGMSPAYLRDELFRPFASDKPGGFGLGAFEARQLVVGMGGTLCVESREGHGTCFTISLPCAPALEVAA